MKVCVVTTSFPRAPQDDRGTFVWEAARAVHAQGIEVRVVAIHSPGTKTKEIIEGIKVWRPRYLWPERMEMLQTPGGGLPIVLRQYRLAWLALPSFFTAQTVATARSARGCDLIHAHWTLSAATAWAGQSFHHCPFVVTVQGSDIFQAARMPFIGRVTQQVLNHCRRVICLSRSLADATIALGVNPNRVTIIPNGVDTEKFSPPPSPRELLLLSVGSLIERKGMKYLIQAMPHIMQQMPDYRLVIIGDGPQKAELVALAESLGVASTITFAGIQTHAQVSKWMRRARLFVMPSLEEALGQVLLEALATGTPCVATRIGGIPDVVSPDVGLLVPPADPAALANAIVSILRAPEQWHTMSQHARLVAVERFSSQRIAARLIEIYRQVLAER